MAENNVQDKRGWYGRQNSLETRGVEQHVHDLYLAGKVKKDAPYLVQMIEDDQNYAAVSRAFGVDFKTAKGWVITYKNKERGNRGVHGGQQNK